MSPIKEDFSPLMWLSPAKECTKKRPLDYYLIESLYLIPLGQKCSYPLQLKANFAVSHYLGNG